MFQELTKIQEGGYFELFKGKNECHHFSYWQKVWSAVKYLLSDTDHENKSDLSHRNLFGDPTPSLK
jgi:hypothetical protein